jgi:ATP-dependent exoDNAse (exonuclease V) beta subunit
MPYQDILPEKKVIRASAGTGKTYRLSLEFISLLLKYRGSTSYDEILVLTFTKKATAEIRQRIFAQMHAIISGNQEGQQLVANIIAFQPQLQIDAAAISYLQEIYYSMLANKDKLRVSTIDSFTNTIFTGLIAPYHNITEPKIDPKINQEYLPELFDEILQDKNLQLFEEIFSSKGYRNLHDYQNFIESLIDNRWIFNFAQQQISLPSPAEIAAAFQEYQKTVEEFISTFCRYTQDFITAKNKAIDWNKFIKKDFRAFICEPNSNDLEIDKMESFLIALFSNPKVLKENYSIFLKPNFWSGNALFKAKEFSSYKEHLDQLCSELSPKMANYLYQVLVRPEQAQLLLLADTILKKYDQIKFQRGIFTYSDITYYTYRYLYDSQLSLYDGNNLLNLFYEQLSYKTRYILIDEFQDTSILQWNILAPLIREALSGMGQRGAGGTIIVGDEKQSIYGWRGGERQLLLKAPDLLGMEKNSETLKRSYRSKKILIDHLNRIFSNAGLHQHLLDYGSAWEYENIDTADPSETGYFELNLINRAETTYRAQALNESDYLSQILSEQIIPLLQQAAINPAETAILTRKNNELEMIARFLDEAGVDYILESSASLLKHRAIQPLIYLINFLVYENSYELLKFLRSDLVLMGGDQLRECLLRLQECGGSQIDWQKFFPAYAADDVLGKLAQLKFSDLSLLDFLTESIQQFHFIEIFPSELDLKNLHKFLELAAEFCKNNRDYPTDLGGFAAYCQAIENKEEFTQLGLSETAALKLMTIHKSKGLEFETVFAFLQGDSARGNSQRGMSVLTSYNQDFSAFEAGAFSYNYHAIMQKAKPDLYKLNQNRAATEELNNIYVQLTRAAHNLIIYDVVNRKNKSLALVAAEQLSDLSIPKQLFATFYQEFSSDFQQVDPDHLRYRAGKLLCQQEPKSPDFSPSEGLADYFGLPEAEYWQEQEIGKALHPEAILRGNIVHNYLAEIRFDAPEVRQQAEQKIWVEMGTLLTRENFVHIIQTANDFLDRQPDYFSKKNWDAAFNERIFFDKQGKEKRIDRILINRAQKEILIIDYKTGEIYDAKQIEEYQEIIRNIKFVRNENYTVKAIFLEVR